MRRSRQGYYGSITFIDEEIGRILQTLEGRGWLESTLIVFTADHGVNSEWLHLAWGSNMCYFYLIDLL